MSSFYANKYELCDMGPAVCALPVFTPVGAADQGKSDKVRDLIKQGADVNIRDFLGMTPLMHAANMGQTDIAGLLIEAGGKCEAVDNAGRTPLMLAAAGGMIGVVELLLDT